MIKIDIGRSKRQASVSVIAPATATEGYLVSDPKHQARKAVPFLRLLGNLLILAGVLMLVGVGGWWGYTQWSVNQDIKQLQEAGVNVEPTLSVAELSGNADPATAVPPTATPTTIPLTILNPLAHAISSRPQAPAAIPDNSPPTHLTIPSVGIDSPVVTVTWELKQSKVGGAVQAEWDVASYAVGHNLGSANPGQPGNVVMAGHVDYKGEVFKNLHNVKKGDEVIIQTDKGQYVYVITETDLVKEDGATPEQQRRNAHYMDPTAEPTLTMITCYPYAIDNYRFVAIGHPYQPETGQSAYTLR